MRKSSHALHLAVIALATYSSALQSHAEELLRIAPGIAESVFVDGAVPGNFTSIVGDPKVADVTFGPKNTLWFVGLTEGTTNFIMLDNTTGKEMYSTAIVVSDSARYNNRIQVHNKALVTSYTVYRCDPICLYSHEVTATEPAALPAGNVRSNSNYTGLPTIPASIKPAGVP